MAKISEKGIASYLSIITISILLAMVLGIIPILITQIKTISGKEDSTIAFSAADTGVEEVMEAIDVGYDYYDYPSNGECIQSGDKKVCDYSACTPLITSNDEDNCGLPSRCNNDNDCLCPVDKCIGYNYYDYPDTGKCENGQCLNCSPITISTNDIPRCHYNPSKECTHNEECVCPPNQCMGLESAAAPSFPWKTPYFGTLGNGAAYKTYIGIDSSSGEEVIQSIGSYKEMGSGREVKRAIELRR
jgi:hypothetical protein